MFEINLILSAWQTKLDTWTNSVDPDETARNEPSHQILHRLPWFWPHSLFQKLRGERVNEEQESPHLAMIRKTGPPLEKLSGKFISLQTIKRLPYLFLIFGHLISLLFLSKTWTRPLNYLLVYLRPVVLMSNNVDLGEKWHLPWSTLFSQACLPEYLRLIRCLP